MNQENTRDFYLLHFETFLSKDTQKLYYQLSDTNPNITIKHLLPIFSNPNKVVLNFIFDK